MRKNKFDKMLQQQKLNKVEIETTFDFKQHTWSDVANIKASLGKFYNVRFTDIDKYFLTKRSDAARERSAVSKYGNIRKRSYILFNLLAPGYGKLDADCYILTAASIFILDCLSRHSTDLSDLYSLLPDDEALISSLIRNDVKDICYDSRLIASVEYVLRYRYKDFSSNYYDEIGNYRSLVSKMIKPKSKDSAHYSTFLKLLNLIPEDCQNQAVTHFNNCRNIYLDITSSALKSDSDDIKNAVKGINRIVDSYNEAIDTLQKSSQNIHPVQDPFAEASALKSAVFNLKNYLNDYNEKQNKLNEIVVSTAYKYSVPEILPVSYQNPAYNPYELCFALLLLIEQEQDFIWLYGETVQMMYTIGHTLPWGIKILYNQPVDKAHSNYKQDVESTIKKNPKPKNWYQLDYSIEGKFDSFVNLSNLVYFATGFIMPRNTSDFDYMNNYLKCHGIKSNAVCEMLMKCMTLVTDSTNKISALNLKNTSVEDELSTAKEELNALRKELSEKDAEISKIKKDFDGMSKNMKKISSDMHHKTGQITKATEEVNYLKEVLSERDEVIETLLLLNQSADNESSLHENSDQQNTYPFITDKRVVIFGGYDNFEREMRNFIAGNVKFVKRSTTFANELVLNADSVWVQINAIDHPMYYRISSLARKHKIPIRYFKQVGAKQCVNQIISYYNSQN